MSTHASTKIDQKEYLKKYLSGDKLKKKKKKREKHDKGPATKVKIIDDDLVDSTGGQEIDEALLLTGEDAPQIVGEYVEEFAGASKALKWRSITVKEEEDDAEVKQETVNDLWGRKGAMKQVKDEFSPPKKKQPSERRKRTPDISPPRKRKDSSPTTSKRRSRSRERNGRHDTARKTHRSPGRMESASSDRSPVRSQNGQRNASRDQSPPRRHRHGSTDNSPPRRRPDSAQTRRERNRYSDQSPPRRKRRSPSDQSPRRHNSSDQSPPRRKKRSTSDQSPQRRQKHSPLATRRERKKSDDQSPPRRKRDDDNSPPRKTNSSLSPVRIKREKRTSDQSPPRRTRIKDEASNSPRRHSRWGKPERSISPPPTHKPKAATTLEGKKAGLQDAQALKVENEERRRREERLFADMSKDVSGRDADVRVRSTGRRGKRARDAEAEDPEVRRRKEAHEQKKQLLYERWGKGLKQIEEHRVRLEEQAHESSKPLARYSNDEDLERHLREQERSDDPMLEYMRQKKKEKQKQEKRPTMPVYQGTYPENRFGIRPGYRWDGVDRSNGYEERWFDVQNEKRAVQDEAYKYSVEDM